MSETRGLMKEFGIEQPRGQGSGICSRRWMQENGILILSNKQLQAIAKKMNEQSIAENQTKSEIVRDVLLRVGIKDDLDGYNDPKEIERFKAEQERKRLEVEAKSKI